MARWATVAEAAEYIKASEGTLYNEISKGSDLGNLFIKKDGLKRLVDLDELDKYLKEGNSVVWCHLLKDGKVERQGELISTDDGYYVIKQYSFVTGFPTEVADFPMDKYDVVTYRSDDEMQRAFDKMEEARRNG